jgi:SAM-dependent methyltransferase
MTEWNDGTLVDLAAPLRFRRETTPIWLATACTLLGCRPPSLTEPFRYADLGCGSGFTALTVAATCPHAEVWAFDINPAHIESGAALARRAGLTNIRFRETSFAALRNAPRDDPPPFDIMVADSVLSILSPENQAHVHALIAKHLRPGGLACLGYDAAAGWTELVPVRTLMRRLYEIGADTSEFAVPDILAWLDRLNEGGARYFQQNPTLADHLTRLRAHPTADVAMALLNRDWNPLMFADVATAMAEARCDFLGHATLQENIPWAATPPKMAELLEAAPSVRIRETMQDIAARTAYRRDIYRRGLAFMPVAEHETRLDAVTVIAAGKDLQGLPVWHGTVPPDPELYGPLVAALREGPLSVAAARLAGPLADCPVEETARAIAMVIAAGHAHPLQPPSVAEGAAPGVARLNAALIDGIADGEDFGYLVSPRSGAAIEIDPLEALTIRALGRDDAPVDLDRLVDMVRQSMRRSGRDATRDGAGTEEGGETVSISRVAIAEILARRVPVFRALGILPAPR